MSQGSLCNASLGCYIPALVELALQVCHKNAVAHMPMHLITVGREDAIYSCEFFRNYGATVTLNQGLFNSIMHFLSISRVIVEVRFRHDERRSISPHHKSD